MVQASHQTIVVSQDLVTEARNQYMNAVLPTLVFEFALSDEVRDEFRLKDFQRVYGNTIRSFLLDKPALFFLRVRNTGLGSAINPVAESKPFEGNDLSTTVLLPITKETPVINVGGVMFIKCAIYNSLIASNEIPAGNYKFRVTVSYGDSFGRHHASSVDVFSPLGTGSRAQIIGTHIAPPWISKSPDVRATYRAQDSHEDRNGSNNQPGTSVESAHGDQDAE